MAISDVGGKSIPELLSLKGRNAVVTGGARGIGLAICQRLAEAGANIVVGDVREDLGKEAAESLAAHWGVKALFCVADVSDGASIAQLADKAVQELGGMDIWVNNAGIYPLSPSWTCLMSNGTVCSTSICAGPSLERAKLPNA